MTAAGQPAASVSARASMQRDRILAAAHKCFAERGFHAASMASIAETAGISAGLIYRYFAGKSEIIQGIVRRQLALLAEDMQMRRMRPPELADLLVEGYARDCGGHGEQLGIDPGLLLEICAEAGRDPAIAEAMNELDATLQSGIERWLVLPVAQGGAGIPAGEAAARALALRLIIDGLKMRQARDPQLDRELLGDALRTALTGVTGATRD